MPYAANRPGWFDSTWTISRQRVSAARWKVFLTVHGIGGDDAAGQPEFPDKALDGRDLIGLVVDLDMAQDQRAFDIESAHQVGRLLVDEVIVAAAQGLAVEGDHPAAFQACALPQGLAMQAENPFYIRSIKPLQDIADRGVGRSAAPSQPEALLEPSEMDLDEGMDAAVGVRPRHHRQDRKEQHVGELVELAFGPARVFDLGQQLKQVGKGTFHGNRPPFRLPAIDSDKACDANPKSRLQRKFPRSCGISDSHQSKER